ncbi:MAG: hypothetical protein HQK83_19840 [Fibrobacteria bacterium]|nr:hypothetical protein [Fibrobacteria bacterium]
MLTFWICLASIQAVIGIACLLKPVRLAFSLFFNHDLTVKIAVPLLKMGLAYMFIRAAWPKVGSPFGFSELVAQYQMLPAFSVNFFSLWLPMLEIIVGIGLIITKWHKEFSFLLFMMMLMFIIALAQTLARDLGVTCGCFDIDGAMDKNDAWNSLMRDIALMGPIVWMWIKGGNRWIWQISRQSSVVSHQ